MAVVCEWEKSTGEFFYPRVLGPCVRKQVVSDDDVTAGNAAHKSWGPTQGDSLVIAMMSPPASNGDPYPPNGIKSLNPILDGEKGPRGPSLWIKPRTQICGVQGQRAWHFLDTVLSASIFAGIQAYRRHSCLIESGCTPVAREWVPLPSPRSHRVSDRRVSAPLWWWLFPGAGAVEHASIILLCPSWTNILA